MKSIFSIIFYDFKWKALSVLAALILWLVGLNISDPSQNILVTAGLRLDNMGILSHEGLILLNEDALREHNIQVGVRGIRSYVDVIRAATPAQLAQILEVSIDFRAVDVDAVLAADGVVVLPLRVSTNFLTAGYEHVSISDNYIYVHLDEEARVNLPVTVVEQGTTSLNFDVQPVILTNSRATVIGPRSVLQTVESIRVHVDVTGIHGEEDVIVQLLVFDEDENDITDQIQLSVTETIATVRVWPVEPMPISVRGVGTLAHGFAISGHEPLPDRIRVVGAQEILDEHDHVLVEVDWSGASESLTIAVDVAEWLPSGIYLYHDEPEEINVNVTIEPIESRTFPVPRVEMRVWGVDALHEVLGYAPNILVNISGSSSAIAAMTAANIGLGLDLRGLPVGTHSVPLAVTLPPGVFLTSSAPAVMVQIHAPAVPAYDYEDEPEAPEIPDWLADPPYEPYEYDYYYDYYDYPEEDEYEDDYAE